MKGGRSLILTGTKEIEFIYCLEGTVRLGVDDEIIQMHEDEIYFFF